MKIDFCAVSHKLSYGLLAVVVLVGLAACAGTKGQSGAVAAPSFSHLRVNLNGFVVFFRQAGKEGEAGQETEIWDSGGVLLQLKMGRVAGLVGLSDEWRRVDLSQAPAWHDAVAANQPLHWVRERDVMPGYRVGMRDEMSLRRIDPPKQSALVDLAPTSLVWFEETVKGEGLPPARFAVAMDGERETPVYGEQCVSAKLCFSWQRSAAAPVAKSL